MEDASLFRRWQDNPCQETLLRLLEALGKSVYPLCFRVLRHHQDAEDAAQKVLLEFLGVLRTLPSMDRMRAWIYRSSILTALSLKRAQRRRARHERAQRTQQDCSISEEEGDLIHRHVADLAEDLRRVVVEHYFEQQTLSALSSKAHCSTGAIWKRLQKAQDELRRSFARAGISGGAVALLAYLATPEVDAARTTGLPHSVIEKARVVTSGPPSVSPAGGWLLLKSAAGAAIAVAAILAYVAYQHDRPLELAALDPRKVPSRRSQPVPAASSAATSSLAPAKVLADKPAAIPEEFATETLFARLRRLRGTLEVCVAKKSFGAYIREKEALHPLVLREPDAYIAFLQMPESRDHFGFFLDILTYPGPVTASTSLPDLPRTVSKGLGELLSTGTKEQKLLIFDRMYQLSQSFGHHSLVEDFVPPSLAMVSGSDDRLRVQALGFLMIHGHEDRLDLVQSVWQKSRSYNSRLICLNILAGSKGSAADELFQRCLEEVLKEQDPKWSNSIPGILRYRLESLKTEEDQDRFMRLVTICFRGESRADEYQRRLSVVGFLPVAKQAVLLRELSGHAPSDAINDRIAKTLEMIDEGEKNPGVLSEFLAFGRNLRAPSDEKASATPPPSASVEDPLTGAPLPPPAPPRESSTDDSPSPQHVGTGNGSAPEAFEVLSKDLQLKAIIKKGKDGFASEFQIWDVEKDDRLLQGWNAFQITAFAFSQDGKRYAMADQDGVVVRSLNGESSCRFSSPIPVNSLSFSADGQTLRSPGETWTLHGR
jgi:RNA polymerase sigma factor (sigma-70 family)